jgi:hypothetical protein
MKRLLNAMLIIAALVATPGAARARESVLGQKESGFALQLNLGVVNIPGSGNNAALAIGLVQGGFFAGWKIDRFIVGLNFDINRFAQGQTMPTPGQPNSTSDTSMSATGILLMPGIQVAVLRSSDARVELYGEFDLGWGHAFNDQTPAPMGPQPETSNNRLVYQLGPGVRYWVHPQFAVGAMAALRGDFLWQSISPPAGVQGQTESISQGTTSIVAQLQFLGVF